MPEKWMTLRAAALAVTGKEISCTTATRWATNGVCGVYLDFEWIGGRRHTTVERMKQFRAKLEIERLSNGTK